MQKTIGDISKNVLFVLGGFVLFLAIIVADAVDALRDKTSNRIR